MLVTESGITSEVHEQNANAHWSIVATESGMLMDTAWDNKPVPRNPPKITTESGRTIEVREEQSENASVRMIVTEFGIATWVRFTHELKAHQPMLVTESGMATDTKLEHLLKELFPMAVTVSGIASDDL